MTADERAEQTIAIAVEKALAWPGEHWEDAAREYKAAHLEAIAAAIRAAEVEAENRGAEREREECIRDIRTVCAEELDTNLSHYIIKRIEQRSKP